MGADRPRRAARRSRDRRSGGFPANGRAPKIAPFHAGNCGQLDIPRPAPEKPQPNGGTTFPMAKSATKAISGDKLAKIIDEAFEQRDGIGAKTKGTVRKAVEEALLLLDSGAARVAERGADGRWQVNQWLKKAVLLSFRLNDMSVIAGGPSKAVWWDKVDSKFKGWKAARFRKSGFRAVPGCVVRRSAYIAPGVVLMPSFVNLGAYVDSGAMIDTWATVGSCAQIGKNCHISGGAGIGGVLEPLQAGPVIIEDNCFIGARSEVAEGVIVREGSVLGMGVYLG